MHTPLSSTNASVYADRLRDMEGEGLIDRIDYDENPPHVEYRLTERGLLLLPLVEFQVPAGAVELVHAGAAVDPSVGAVAPLPWYREN